MLTGKLSGLTLDSDHGRFLADKSYAFDTMFFACRFIERFRFGDIYRKHDLLDKSNAYIRDLFCLRPASQIGNYFTEAIALLVFCNVLECRGRKGSDYEIVDEELLEFIGSSFENAYIFLYMLCRCVLEHDGLWSEYVEFCRAGTLEEKQAVYMRFRNKFIAKDRRVRDPDKRWGEFVPKYPMVVLNFANRQNMIARTMAVKKRTVGVKDISLNTKGTRANAHLPKKNAYLDDLSESYIIETLRPCLVADIPRFDEITYSDSFSVDVADTKLDMLDTEGATSGMRRRMQQDKYRFSGRGGRTRTVQGEFRSGLLRLTPHRCPICGFDFENILIASHIKPYAKCDDTYDAMNPNNGLLLCPVCDRLFESADYVTIDYRTGEVLCDKRLESVHSLEYLRGRVIAPDYIDCERRHYLKWHNETFRRKHAETAWDGGER